MFSLPSPVVIPTFSPPVGVIIGVWVLVVVTVITITPVIIRQCSCPVSPVILLIVVFIVLSVLLSLIIHSSYVLAVL